MAAVIGGDILEITFNHPTHGSGVIYPKSGEDHSIDLGGFRGNDDNNSVDGGGRNIRQLTRNRWSCEAVCAWDMNTSLELETINKLAADPVEATWTITHVNGSVYAGTGAPVGDLVGNSNQATFQLKIAGGGKCEKIA